MGLDFGDYNNIEVVYQQTEHPENLTEHPMSINMRERFREFLQQYPAEISQADNEGFTLLHRETIAGNRTSIEILLEKGADKGLKTHNGKTALDYARQLNWTHIIPLLEA
ncbi:ankyrin repeat domain-containing protein [Filimonas effusa]|uniref:ankyrin repeat domain-containing protein n=1 Tax=Filimonas effusa TaxID=2508721 RepID=UPI001C7095E6|nr:ankyrin repeat domain-containing protein [Filimonas effusa]